MKKLNSSRISLPWLIGGIVGIGFIITLFLVRYGYERDCDTARGKLFLLEHVWTAQFKSTERFLQSLGENFEARLAQTPLTSPSSKTMIGEQLDFCSNTLLNSICYLIDLQGNVLDSSNRDDRSSFVGHNFKDRSYFKDALNGKLGVLAAVGLASSVPGSYYARPIFIKDKMAAVFVIKNNFIWSSPLNSNEIHALTDLNGVILASNKETLVLRTVGPIDGELSLRLISEHIYPKILDPLFKKSSGLFWWEGFLGKIYELPLKDRELKFVILSPLRNTVFSFFLGLLIMVILAGLTFFIWLWNASLTRIRERMIFSDRMASIGNLAAGLAHEINNPLVVLKYNVSLFRQLPAEILEGKLEQALVKQDEAIDRVTDIVRGLQEYTRLSSDGIGAINTHEVVNTAMTLINKVYAKEHVFIEKKLGAVHPWVEANSARLLQSIISLVSFFRELRTERDVPRHVLIETENQHQRLRVLVKEKETKFNSSDLSKIFEPFFPISSLGRHSLGPYIAYSLVHNMNGDITAYIDEEGSLVFALNFSYIPLNELVE